jgi:CspA family cold shock protein
VQQGTVKWFNETKGYGFITPEDGGGDIFFHVTQVKSEDRPLDEGDEVTFHTVEGTRGPAAEDVRKA